MTPSSPEKIPLEIGKKTSLHENIHADRYRVAWPILSLFSAPSLQSESVTQALFGEEIDLHTPFGAFAFGELVRDRYRGFFLVEGLDQTPQQKTTHWVCVPKTFLYPEPSIKTPPCGFFYLGSELRIEAEKREFLLTQNGYVFHSHLLPIGHFVSSPWELIFSFIGAPYLWGGRTHGGIDCSGLVQAVFQACGWPCLRDSAEIEEQMKHGMSHDSFCAAHTLFWDGHVAFIFQENEVIHASGAHMQVVREPVGNVVERIGPPRRYKNAKK